MPVTVKINGKPASEYRAAPPRETTVPHGPVDPATAAAFAKATPVTEKTEAALRSQAKHSPSIEKREAARDELDRRAQIRAEERQTEREKAARAAQEKRLREQAQRRYFDAHGVMPSEEQVTRTVQHLREKENAELPLGERVGDCYLPQKLAGERATERELRRQNQRRREGQ